MLIEWDNKLAWVATILAVCYGIQRWYKDYAVEQKKRKFAKELEGMKKNIVYLYVYPRWDASINPSALCTKVETFLRMGKIPYIVKQSWQPGNIVLPTPATGATAATTSAPSGVTFPCIVYNGCIVCNSQEIVEFFIKKLKMRIDQPVVTAPPPKSAGGGAAAHKLCLALGVRRAIEGNCVQALERSFFLDHPELLKVMLAKERSLQPTMCSSGGADNPFEILRGGIKWYKIKATKKRLQASGYMDLSNNRYQEELLRDVQMFESLIASNGPRGYILSTADQKPTSYDAGVFAVLHQLHRFYTYFVKPVRDDAKSPSSIYYSECEAMSYLVQSDVLQEYIARIEKLYYPDMVRAAAAEGEEGSPEDDDDGQKRGGLGVMNRRGKQEFLKVTHYGQVE